MQAATTLPSVRTVYLQAADFAVGLLREPAVAARWEEQSALAEMKVGAVAGHLARQVFSVQQLLADPVAAAEPIPLLAHYAKSSWVDARLHDEPNVTMRRSSEAEAASGPQAVADRAATVVAELRDQLPGEPAGRTVFLPWGPWSLTLDDFLVTRVMEIAVHGDDLACSVGLGDIALPEEAADLAAGLLLRIALRKHGQAAILRALSRAERAPRSIVAF